MLFAVCGVESSQWSREQHCRDLPMWWKLILYYTTVVSIPLISTSSSVIWVYRNFTSVLHQPPNLCCGQDIAVLSWYCVLVLLNFLLTLQRLLTSKRGSTYKYANRVTGGAMQVIVYKGLQATMLLLNDNGWPFVDAYIWYSHARIVHCKLLYTNLCSQTIINHRAKCEMLHISG